MDYMEVSAKTVNEAITEACQKLSVTSDRLEYEVVDEGSNGFLGIGSKPAVIKARVKVVEVSLEEKAKTFLNNVFSAMNMAVVVEASYDENENALNIDLSGEEMGVLWSIRKKRITSG